MKKNDVEDAILFLREFVEHYSSRCDKPSQKKVCDRLKHSVNRIIEFFNRTEDEHYQMATIAEKIKSREKTAEFFVFIAMRGEMFGFDTKEALRIPVEYYQKKIEDWSDKDKTLTKKIYAAYKHWQLREDCYESIRDDYEEKEKWLVMLREETDEDRKAFIKTVIGSLEKNIDANNELIAQFS